MRVVDTNELPEHAKAAIEGIAMSLCQTSHVVRKVLEAKGFASQQASAMIVSALNTASVAVFSHMALQAGAVHTDEDCDRMATAINKVVRDEDEIIRSRLPHKNN